MSSREPVMDDTGKFPGNKIIVVLLWYYLEYLGNLHTIGPGPIRSI